ncbi:glycosyltransferase family 2 protein [Rhodoferax sp.]|uniref:glycosyltransferase family 2 protein n=1 Tax=Rhodoferax sp. TaxID=50421 RepID=UPI002621D3D0|nr:glycosyltransferase family 2 protein [Rhodoferax sp.]MDD2809829.1 glycosyltransferase family 2 protein [Rhodoferax sp.]MDD4943212.1 glycosyltransferase family 2 protein [Rhodoferax sp.]
MAVTTCFVILTYNRVDALVQVLRALAPQCTAQHEIVIADDGSSAAHVAALRAQLPKFSCAVSHVWHPDTGFTASQARNLGAMASQAEYLVFLDGDCVPNAHFVKAHEALAEAGYFVNGNRVLLSERLTQQVVTGEVDLLAASAWDGLRWRFQGDTNKLAHWVYWPQAPGRCESQFRWKQIRSCNFALWRRDFMAVNGFDESFEGWGHEDADLVLRLHHLGLSRKNGFFSTEVFHLWHRQNSRHAESVNYQRVIERSHTDIVEASRGIRDNLSSEGVVVTALN